MLVNDSAIANIASLTKAAMNALDNFDLVVLHNITTIERSKNAVCTPKDAPAALIRYMAIQIRVAIGITSSHLIGTLKIANAKANTPIISGIPCIRNQINFIFRISLSQDAPLIFWRERNILPCEIIYNILIFIIAPCFLPSPSTWSLLLPKNITPSTVKKGRQKRTYQTIYPEPDNHISKLIWTLSFASHPFGVVCPLKKQMVFLFNCL